MTSLHELEENDHLRVDEPEAKVFSQQIVSDLKSALSGLPLVCQQVYARSRIEGWTHAEIARAMGAHRIEVQYGARRGALAEGGQH